VDESGQPVAGACVEGTWELWVANFYGISDALATTDAKGSFQLEGIPPLVEVKLSTRGGPRAMLEPLQVWPGEQKPLTLRVTRSATTAVRGRVTATDGRPIANALVRFRSRSDRGPGGFVTRSIEFDHQQEIRTDTSGVFETPRELSLTREFCLE